MEAVVDLLEVISWMARASPTARGEVAAHEVMYCQKASLFPIP